MEQFQIICPNCGQKISRGDIQHNDKVLEIWKQDFEKSITTQIQKSLAAENEKQLNNELTVAKLQTKLQIEKEKEGEIKSLYEKIKNLEVEIENKETDISLKLANFKNDLMKEKQKEIDLKNLKINELDNELKMKSATFDNQIKLKEKEVEISFSKEIEILNSKIESFKNERKLMEIELKNIQNERDLTIANQINEKIVPLQNLLEKSKSELVLKEKEFESKISSLKLELEEKRLKEAQDFKNQIHDLEMSNEKFKILNNKTKGENWEYEVQERLSEIYQLTEDRISKINDTGKKADFLHEIYSNGTKITSVMMEVKNAVWKDEWETKLLNDMNNANVKYGILISTSLYSKYKIKFGISKISENIYLSDQDSFGMVSQIVKKIAIIDAKLNELAKNSDSVDENTAKIVKFNEWKATKLAVLIDTFNKNISKISKAETSVLNKIDEISKSRKAVTDVWQEVFDFITIAFE